MAQYFMMNLPSRCLSRQGVYRLLTFCRDDLYLQILQIPDEWGRFCVDADPIRNMFLDDAY